MGARLKPGSSTQTFSPHTGTERWRTKIKAHTHKYRLTDNLPRAKTCVCPISFKLLHHDILQSPAFHKALLSRDCRRAQVMEATAEGRGGPPPGRARSGASTSRGQDQAETTAKASMNPAHKTAHYNIFIYRFRLSPANA